MNVRIDNVSDELLEWCKDNDTTNEDIMTALELGYTSVKRVNELVAKKVSTLQETNTRMSLANLPVKTGQIGEEFIEDILKARWGEVANVAKNPKSGDLTLFIQHRKIIVEVKNYTHNVPTTGIEKFQRDLSTAGADGGVFISLKTPITGVTADFTIKYERGDLKTIPCAYIVSSEKSLICAAVSMIANIITSLDYISAEIHTRDKLIGSIHDLSGSLNDITRVRHDLQTTVGDIYTTLHKTALSLVTTEGYIRKSLDTMKSEIFTSVQPNLEQAIAEFASIPNYVKATPEIKSLIGKVMQHVHSQLHSADINGSMWRVSAKKCTNSQCGIALHFFANKVQVAIPLTKVAPDSLAKTFATLGKHVSVIGADECLYIDINALTFEFIREIIQSCKILLT